MKFVSFKLLIRWSLPCQGERALKNSTLSQYFIVAVYLFSWQANIYCMYKDPLIYFDVELKRREMRCRPLHEIPETVNCNLSYNDLDVCNIKQQSFSKQFVAKVVFAQTRTISRIPQKLPVVFKKTRSVNNTTYIMNLYMPYQL